MTDSSQIRRSVGGGTLLDGVIMVSLALMAM
jgi:hypothetical protein